jgi:hypothetical protein
MITLRILIAWPLASALAGPAIGAFVRAGGGCGVSPSPRAIVSNFPPLSIDLTHSTDWHRKRILSSEQFSENLSKIIDGQPSPIELVRAVYPQHTMKLLARLMNVPIGTAREWLYSRFPPRRTQELALALLPELQRRREEFERTEQWIKRLARGVLS